MSDLTELEDRVAALERTVEKLYNVTREFRDVMVWFKTETDKLVSAAGPLLAMAGPLLGQMLSADPDAVIGELIGAPQPQQTAYELNGVDHG